MPLTIRLGWISEEGGLGVLDGGVGVPDPPPPPQALIMLIQHITSKDLAEFMLLPCVCTSLFLRIILWRDTFKGLFLFG